MKSPIRYLFIGALLVGLASCATMSEDRTLQTEDMLAAAGFKMMIADSVAKMNHLETMIQRKVMPHSKNGKNVFIYADDKVCTCLFVGDEKAYDSYEKMAVQGKIANEREEASAQQEAAADEMQMDWGLWGLDGMYW